MDLDKETGKVFYKFVIALRHNIASSIFLAESIKMSVSIITISGTRNSPFRFA
jgi:predicted helicase